MKIKELIETAHSKKRKSKYKIIVMKRSSQLKIKEECRADSLKGEMGWKRKNRIKL